MNEKAYFAASLLLAIIASSCSPTYVTEEPSHIEQPKAISTPEPAESGVGSGEDTEGLIDLTGIKSGEVPADVQEHLEYAATGGGFICQSFPLELNENLNENVYVYSLPGGLAEWCFVGLGEAIDETVTATLEFPDGSLHQLEASVEYDEYGSMSNLARFRYRFNETSDRKLHRLIADLSGRHIEIRFIPIVEGYYFGGFDFNEPVRVLIYENFLDYANFHSEQYTTADSTGELWIKFKDLFDLSPHIFVIGETTGCRYKKLYGNSIMRDQVRGTIDLECDKGDYQQP